MTVSVLGPNQARVSLDYDEVHQISVGLLSSLEENEITVGPALGGLALSIARLMGDAMTPEQEAIFVNGVLEFAGMFFAGEEN